MKALKLGAAAVLAFAISGCGDDAAGGNAAAEQNFQVEKIAAPNGGDWASVVSETPEGGFRMGNPDAKVKVVEFGSMTCGVCAAFAAEGEPALIDKYVKSGQVSFEFRNFVRDGADLSAALLARCSGPSAFFPLTDQLFAAQNEWLGKLQTMSPEQQQQLGTLPPGQAAVGFAQAAGLDQFVRVRGIPAAKAQSCLADAGQVQRLVSMNETAVKEHQISGTPTFLINNNVVPNSANWATLEPAIQQSLR